MLSELRRPTSGGRAPYGFTTDRFRQAILDTDAYGRAVASSEKDQETAALDVIAAHAPSAETAVPRKM